MKYNKDEYLKYLFEKYNKDIQIPFDKQKTEKQKAKDILKQLDENPDVFKEFNTLLRNRKIKKIKKSV